MRDGFADHWSRSYVPSKCRVDRARRARRPSVPKPDRDRDNRDRDRGGDSRIPRAHDRRLRRRQRRRAFFRCAVRGRFRRRRIPRADRRSSSTGVARLRSLPALAPGDEARMTGAPGVPAGVRYTTPSAGAGMVLRGLRGRTGGSIDEAVGISARGARSPREEGIT